LEISFVKTYKYWEEILLPYKTDTDPLRLIFLVDNLNALQVAAAWCYAINCYDEEESDSIYKEFATGEFTSRDPHAVWERIWDGTIVNFDNISIMAGISHDRTVGVFTMLKNARLIFPNNTIHDQARKIVSTYIVNQIKKSNQG